ncbi:MAG: glycosyltransferase family 39 protein [Solirubrobacteraceae bacterium]
MSAAATRTPSVEPSAALSSPAPPSPRLSDAARDRLAVLGPTVLGLALCFFEITTRSLGFDEAATVTIAAQSGAQLGSAIAHDGGNMSGFYLVLHVLMSWFGNGALVLRLPSALASVATVAFTGTIALRLFGRRAALSAGLLAAVSLPLIFWAQNARGYALMVAFVSAVYLVFISLRERSRPAGWIAYAVLMSLATYSSFVAVLVIPAQLLMLLSRTERRRLLGFVLSLGGMAVACVPLIVLAAQRGSGQLFWVPRPTREIEVQVLQSLTSAGLEPSFHATATTTLLLVLTIVLLIAAAVSLLPVLQPARRDRRDWGAGLTLSWLLVPVLLTLIYSLIFQPLFLPRNLLMSLPAVAILLGAGLSHPRLSPRVAWTALAILVVLRALQLVPSYGTSPEPWREASAYVVKRAQPGDCVAFYPADGRMAFQYYFARRPDPGTPLPRPILPVVRFGTVRTYVEDYATLTPGQIRRRGASCRRLWFVSSHEGQPNGPPPSRANRARFLALQTHLERAFGDGQTRQFGYASAIHVRLLPGRRRGTG